MDPIKPVDGIDRTSSVSVSKSDAVAVANTLPPLTPPKEITASIQESKNTDWKKTALRVLNFLAGLALGALIMGASFATNLLITTIAYSPVGWAIAGSVLIISLIGSAYYGGFEEFKNAVLLSLGGLTAGAAIVVSEIAAVAAVTYCVEGFAAICISRIATQVATETRD